MPTWSEKSFSLVKKGGYLDQLAEIYPAPPATARSIPGAERDQIFRAFQGRDQDFLKVLLRREKFPFNDPFVSFLRQKPEEIERNPKTVERICRHLREMGLPGILDSLGKAPEFNRQMGPLFKSWLKQKYPFTDDAEKFQKSKSLLFLGLGEEELRQFANSIGCGLKKRPDFVAKIKSRFVVGEAKFIGSEGGNQNRAFDDALSLASQSFKNAVTIAVLDGIIWIPESGQMAKKLANFSGNALTALLLDKFLVSL